ncbi:MAG: CPBP family intramembrane glutamic endopeptidase [Gammaproteobacteria bacterium]
MNNAEHEKFFKWACYFESSLILIALILGWIAGVAPFVNLHFEQNAFFYGLMGAAPLFLLLMALSQLDVSAVQDIRKLLLDTLGGSLYRLQWQDLLVLSAIAGISEEILFRGVLQPWLESAWGLTAGLLASNIIFGLVHAVTPLYAVLAGLVGVYLGLSLDYGGQRNLLIPIMIHGIYDFLAFMVIMRAYAEEHRQDE